VFFPFKIVKLFDTFSLETVWDYTQKSGHRFTSKATQ